MSAALPNRRTLPLLRCGVFLLLATAATAQTTRDVVLSEVRADGSDRWIELYNRGAASVDLSTWSLYQATDTANAPQNYWYGFPAGTSLAAGDFLLVHWLQPWRTPQAHELWTGDSAGYFLFGLGAEPLRGTTGALALLRSQQNGGMSTASVVDDWVSWGAGNFRREDLAQQAGLWQLGHFAPAFTAGQSLARDTAHIGQFAAPEFEWFRDDTPSPLAPNVTGAAVSVIGSPCLVFGNHLLGPPVLGTSSVPALGNAAFGLQVSNTTGLLFETCFVVFAGAAAPPGLPPVLPPPAVGPRCPELIDYRDLIGALLLRTTISSTSVPLSLAGLSPALAGLQLYVQALVLDLYPGAFPPFQATTNALEVTIGG